MRSESKIQLMEISCSNVEVSYYSHARARGLAKSKQIAGEYRGVGKIALIRGAINWEYVRCNLRRQGRD